MAPPTLVELIDETVARCCEMDASLNERLTIVANRVRELSPPFAEAVDRLVERLQQAGAGANAPQPGEAMPPFVLPDENGRLIDLHDLLEEGPVAVVFNRGHWCPYCRLNTVALAEAHEQAAAGGAQIIAITPEQQTYTARLKTWAKAPFPVLSDIDNGYALSLGLAIWLGTEMERFIAIAGVDLPRYQGSAAWMLPIPATFVVGADGIIRARYVDPDYRQRMAIEDLLAALKAAGSAGRAVN